MYLLECSTVEPRFTNTNIRLCIKVGRGQGDGDIGTRVWGLGDVGTQDEGLEDIKYGTQGHVGRGHREVKYRDTWDAECEYLLQKSEINAIPVTFLVNIFWCRQPILPSLGFLHACLRSEDSAKTPCIEESETVVLVLC